MIKLIKNIIIIYLLFLTGVSYAAKDFYPNAQTAFSGAGTYCQNATPVNFSWTFSTQECGSGGGGSPNVNLTVTWYQDDDLTQNEGDEVLVKTTASTAATTTYTYTPSTATVGAKYYYAKVTWSAGTNAPCAPAGSFFSTTSGLVTINSLPTTAAAGTDITVCNAVVTATLAGNAAGGGETGTWTTGSSVTIGSINSETSGISTIPVGTSVLTWTIADDVSGCTTTDNVNIIRSDNDDCACAEDITIDAACTSGSVGSSHSQEAGENDASCGTARAESVWYKFTATQSFHTIVVDKTAGGCTMDIAVYDDACVSTSEIECQNAITSAGDRTFMVSGLTPSNVYNIQFLYTSGGPCGAQSDFCVSVLSTYFADQCADAATVAIDGSTISATLQGATDLWSGQVGCQSADGHQEIWFTGTPTQNTMDFTINNLGAGFTGDIELILVSARGDCCGLSLIAGGSSCGTAPMNASFDVIPGKQYYWTVSSSNGENASNTTFDIAVNQSNDSQPFPESISSANDLTFGTCSTYNLDGAADNWTGTQACQSGDGHPDVWFMEEITSNGTLYFEIGNLGSEFTGDIELILAYEASGSCTGVTVVGGSCGTTSLSANFAVTSGRDYFWTVSSSNAENAEGTIFDICVQMGSSCAINCARGENAIAIYSTETINNADIVSCEMSGTGGTSNGEFVEVYDDGKNNSYTSVAITSEPVITTSNINCMNSDILFTKTGGGGNNWTSLDDANHNATLPDATDALTVQYNSSAGTGWQTITTANGTYTEYFNLMMDKPSSGSVLGTDEGCSGTYNYQSSEAGTDGYTYSWGLNETGCASCAGAIDDNVASATDITLTHNEATLQVVTVTLSITSECCGALDPINYAVTVYPTPAAPSVVNATPSQCEGGSYIISVSSPTAGYSYNYYDAATAGTYLGSGVEYTIDPVPDGGDIYYVAAISNNGCTSSSRTSVNLSETNTSPTGNGSTYCANGVQMVSVTAGPSGTIYTWYDAAAAGNQLQQGTGLTFEVNATCTPATCTQSVWVTGTQPDGCVESARVEVQVTVTGNPTTTTWDGSTDSDWFDETNWSDCVPSCEVDAVLPNVATDPIITFADGIANGTDGVAKSKDLTMQANSSLSFGDAKASLEVCGDWSQDAAGIFTANSGKVTFTGDAKQTYSNANSTAGQYEFYNVGINNTTSTSTALDISASTTDFVVGTSGNLALTDGVIYTGAKKVDINNSSGGISAGTTASYIDGNLDQAVVNGGSYHFPVGNTNSYQYMNVSNVSNVSGGLTDLSVNFDNPANATGTGLPITPTNWHTFTAILNNGGTAVGTGHANGGVWTVTPNVGSMDYTVTLVGRNYDNHTAGQCVLKRATTGPGAWQFLGTYASQTVDGTTSLSVQHTGFSGFSQFGVGTGSPITLAANIGKFYLECVNNKVVLNWISYSEINCEKYIIERSDDNKNWNEISSILGAGNSNEEIKYSYVDESTSKNKEYVYRVSQIDFDGKNYSVGGGIINNCNNEFDGNSSVFVYDGKTIIVLVDGTVESGLAKLSLIDVTGKEVMYEEFTIQQGIVNRVEINQKSLANGIYFTILSTTSGLGLTEKIYLGQ